MLRGKVRNILLLAIVALLAIVPMVTSQGGDAAPVAPETQYRIAAIDSGGYVQRSVLLAQGVKTMSNTTPVNGDKVCVNGDPALFAAQLTLTGTMTGTNPVVTIVLQNSIDDGLTWRNVGSAFAAINATVTPSAGQEQVTFSDQAGAINTATVYGDCFRVRYTWAGTGTVTANVGVRLISK